MDDDLCSDAHDSLPRDDGVAVHLRLSGSAAPVGAHAVALEDAVLAGDQADHPSTPATSVCLEPITKMLSSLNSLGGLVVSLIAGAVIVVILGVAGVRDPLVPELLR
jgi:hypothetical protein